MREREKDIWSKERDTLCVCVCVRACVRAHLQIEGHCFTRGSKGGRHLKTDVSVLVCFPYSGDTCGGIPKRGEPTTFVTLWGLTVMSWLKALQKYFTVAFIARDGMLEYDFLFWTGSGCLLWFGLLFTPKQTHEEGRWLCHATKYSPVWQAWRVGVWTHSSDGENRYDGGHALITELSVVLFWPFMGCTCQLFCNAFYTGKPATWDVSMCSPWLGDSHVLHVILPILTWQRLCVRTRL